MKSIKYLLAAFVVSAMFASCAKEEIAIAPENEIVGAEVIGTNVSVDFGKDVQTKLTDKGLWEDTDRLGFGWLGADENTPTATLTVNHMFKQIREDGEARMATQGNVYKGWHFGYYPFKYMENPGEDFILNINPDQVRKGNEDRYSTSIYLSAREYLTSADLNDDYQLETKFDMFQAVKSIVVNVTPELTDDVLKNLPILSVEAELGVGAGAFYANNRVRVNPSLLPDFVMVDGEYDKAETKEAFYAVLPSVFSGTAASHVKVGVDNEEINLTEKQTLRIHVIPRPLAISPANVKFIVNVPGGYFTIDYTAVTPEHPELSAVEKANNEAIDKLIKNYKADGALSSYELNEDGLHIEGVSLDFVLTADMFEPEFVEIASEDEWDAAVAVVDALGLNEVTFTLAKTRATTPANWYFNKVDADGNLITLPKTAKLTVGNQNDRNEVLKASEKLYIGSAGEWPAGDITVSGTVEVLSTLTLPEGVTLNAANVINNGRINVSRLATLKNTTNNANKRIHVVYGSKLVDITNNGIISYTVLANGETPTRINKMMSIGVNTFSVNEGVTFDFMMSTPSKPAEDEYNDAIAPCEVLDFETLATRNIEMAGGVLVGEPTVTQVSVKDVLVKSGSNTIKDININGNLTVKTGASLELNSTETVLGNYKVKNEMSVAGEVHVDGNLVADLTVNANSVDNKDGNILVNDGYTIWYKTEYTQGGIADGDINKRPDPSPISPDATVSTVTGNNGLLKKLNTTGVNYVKYDGVLPGNTEDLPAYDLKGKTLELTQPLAAGATYKFINGTINCEVVVVGVKAVTFENIKFTAALTSESVLKFNSTNTNIDVTFKGCFFNTTNSRPIVMASAFEYSGKLTIEDCLFACKSASTTTYYEMYIGNMLTETAKVKINGNIFEAGFSVVYTGVESKLEVTNNIIAAQAELYTSLSNVDKATKDFANYLIENNTFNNVFKFKVWEGDKYNYISEL